MLGKSRVKHINCNIEDLDVMAFEYKKEKIETSRLLNIFLKS